MRLFCVTQFAALQIVTANDLPTALAKTFNYNMAEVFENSVKLFVWISRRYYEVMIFRSLQNSSNRLESLSADELVEIARALLDILVIGSTETCMAKDSFLVSISITC